MGLNRRQPFGHLLAIAVGWAPASALGRLATLQAGAELGLGLIALVALTKWVVSVLAGRKGAWMDRVLPLVSMSGICLILAIITAHSSDRLRTVGVALILAAMLHNAIGYLLGYWLSRAVRLDEITCRTIAIEVGMQNGGMATGLAMGVLKSADAALAPAPALMLPAPGTAALPIPAPVPNPDGSRASSREAMSRR